MYYDEMMIDAVIVFPRLERYQRKELSFSVHEERAWQFWAAAGGQARPVS